MSKIFTKVQFTKWDKVYYCDVSGFDVKKNTDIIVNVKGGNDLAKVIKIVQEKDIEQNGEFIAFNKIAVSADIEKLETENKNKKNALNYCKGTVNKLNLPMKLVDAHFSYDGRRITFAFIANGRVDFRELVKNLTSYFQKVIRLHQIGVRDEAKLSSDIGSCGLKTCCTSFLDVLGNVNSDLAEFQQVSHRGSERLSGVCGRLHCCLNYEQSLYENLAENFPAKGSHIILTDGGRGLVTGWNILRRTLEVRLESAESTIEVELAKVKKIIKSN